MAVVTAPTASGVIPEKRRRGSLTSVARATEGVPDRRKRSPGYGWMMMRGSKQEGRQDERDEHGVLLVDNLGLTTSR